MTPRQFVQACLVLVAIGLLLAGILVARLHAVTTGPGNRFYLTDVNAVGEGRNVYLLHDTSQPNFCMMVLESSTAFGHAMVWTPRNCAK